MPRGVIPRAVGGLGPIVDPIDLRSFDLSREVELGEKGIGLDLQDITSVDSNVDLGLSRFEDLESFFDAAFFEEKLQILEPAYRLSVDYEENQAVITLPNSPEASLVFKYLEEQDATDHLVVYSLTALSIDDALSLMRALFSLRKNVRTVSFGIQRGSPFFEEVIASLQSEPTRYTQLNLPEFKIVIEEASGMTVYSAKDIISGMLRYSDKGVLDPDSFIMVTFGLRDIEALPLAVVASQAASFNELADIVERYDEDLTVGRFSLSPQAVATLLRNIFNIAYPQEVWRLEDVPLVIGNRVLQLARSYQARLKVVLGDSYEPIHGVSDWSDFRYAVYNLAKYAAAFNDPDLSNLDKNFRSASSRNLAKLRTLLGERLASAVRDPLSISNILTIFSKHPPERAVTDLDIAALLQLSANHDWDWLTFLAARSRRPLGAVRVLLEFAKTGLGDADILRIATVLRHEPHLDLDPTELLDLIDMWRLNFGTLGVVSEMLITASPSVHRALNAARVLPEDTDVAVVMEELKQLGLEGAYTDEELQKMQAQGDIYSLHGVISNWPWKDSVSRRDIDAVMRALKAISLFSFEAVKSMSKSWFLGAASVSDLLEAIRNFGPVKRVLKNDHLKFDAGDGIVVTLKPGFYESAFGLAVSVGGEKESFGSIGFNLMDRSFDIVHLQGRRHVHEGDLESFRDRVGGADPMAWVSMVVTKVLLRIANETGRQVRFIHGEYVWNAYPHAGSFNVTPDPKTAPFWERPATFMAGGYIEQAKEEQGIDTPKIGNRVSDYDRSFNRGPHTIRLYNATATNMGFGGKNGDTFFVWPPKKTEADIGKTILSNTKNPKLNREKLQQSVDAAADKLYGILKNLMTSSQFLDQ